MKRFVLIFVWSLFLSISFLMVPQVSTAQMGGGCTVASNSQGPIIRFRSFPNNINFPQNWFVLNTNSGNGIPFVYLDLEFTDACLNQTVTMTIFEEDTAFDDVINQFNNQAVVVTNKQNTFYFRPGTEQCDNNLVGPDCEYYVEIKYQGNLIYSSENGGARLDYDAPSTPQMAVVSLPWSYFGFVNASNFPGYSYGTYVSDQDPAALASEGGAGMGESEGGAGMGESEGGASNTGEYTPEALDCGNTQGVGCIQNPLGPGSNLGTFLESLIGIIVQAGIPLVVLALVYSGFRFVLAQGNPEKLVEARRILLWTVVGTAILLGAWTIATIVSNTIAAIIT